MAAGQSKIDLLTSPAQEVRLAFERGVCAGARAPFSRQPSSVGSERRGNPVPKSADLPSTSGTTISDVAEAGTAEGEAVESREQGSKLQRHPGGAGRRKKRGSGRGRRRGRGDRRLAVATARAERGPGPLSGGGRARIRRIQRPTATLQCEPLGQQFEGATAPPLEPEPAVMHADRSIQAPAEENHGLQEIKEAAAEAPAGAADGMAEAEHASTPEGPPRELQAVEPAASEPMLRELYPVPAHSAPARRSRSQPPLSMPRSDAAEEVTSAPPSAAAAAAPCGAACAAAAAVAAPQEPPQAADGAALQRGRAAAAPGLQPAAAVASGSAGRSQPCSEQPSAQPQLPLPAAAAAPLPKPAATSRVQLQLRPASNSGTGRSRVAGQGAPRKRGRPPQMVPHPHTGELVRKRDLIKARINPKTGERLAVRHFSFSFLFLANRTHISP